jgi:hypothetical protein
MRLGVWWRRTNGRAKAVTVLATVLMLQIGLCFGTPTATSWYHALLRINSRDPFQALGLMMWQSPLVGFGFPGLRL